MNKRPRVSHEQRKAMFRFMQNHPDFARGRVIGPDTTLKRAFLITEMASVLNAIELGATKTPEKWWKCWQDWRCDTKAKASRLKKYRGGSEDGPGPTPLTELEENLLQFCVVEMPHGVEEVPDAQEQTQDLAEEESEVAEEELEEAVHSRPRVSREQRRAMFRFMQQHPDFARGRVTGPDVVLKRASLIRDMASVLNAIGLGATKTPERWWKCWQDWRCDTKAKASRLKRYWDGTEDGPGPAPLTELEENLLQFCVVEIPHGVEGVQDAQEQAQELAEEELEEGTHSRWQDWRCDTTAKVSRLKRYRGGTEDEPGPAPLTELGENLLQYCVVEMPHGGEEVSDPLEQTQEPGEEELEESTHSTTEEVKAEEVPPRPKRARTESDQLEKILARQTAALDRIAGGMESLSEAMRTGFQEVANALRAVATSVQQPQFNISQED